MRTIRRIILLMPAAVLLACIFSLSANALEAPRIPKEELKARLGSPEIIVVDVRAVTDWLLTKKKIKTAVREDPRKPEEWINRYPKDKTIVLYCA